MQHPSQRYISAIARNLAELQRAILNRDAMQSIEAERATSYSLLRLAYLALFNDYMAHAMKIFEEGTRVASFWYLYRTDQGIADRFMREESIDAALMHQVSVKLKRIRDATHFHIDADSVVDTRHIWRDAGITGAELSRAIDSAWKVVAHLQQHHGLPSVQLLPEMSKDSFREQIRRLTTGNDAL